MNKFTYKKSADLYNMILGALIALSSEQHVGKLANKAASENVFLGKWLKRAKKQKCYPKSTSDDIDNLLHLYFLEGRTGDLASLFRKIFREFQLLKGISQQFEQTEKQRFDSAMKHLAKDDWHISLPIKQDHSKNKEYRATKSKELFTSEFYWKGVFDDEGNLTKDFSIFVVSFPQDVIDCLYSQGFILIKGLSCPDILGKYYYQYILFPDNKFTGEVAIPSEI